MSALVNRTSGATFTDTTGDPPDNWAAGTVELVDDGDNAASAMFDTTNMVPGDSISNCIEVDFTGSSFDLDPVTLRGAVTDGGLGHHLDIVISEGTGGGFGESSTFSGSAVLTGTLNEFASTYGACVTARPATGRSRPRRRGSTRSTSSSATTPLKLLRAGRPAHLHVGGPQRMTVLRSTRALMRTDTSPVARLPRRGPDGPSTDRARSHRPRRGPKVAAGPC